MNEFIEKVKSRLGEMREFHNELSRSNELSGVSKCCQKINAGCFAKAIQIVDEVAEEYNNGWIPVSERLPDVEISEKTKYGLTIDNGEDFLVTHENGYVFATEFWAKSKRFSDEGVVAWMPLPKPYKQEGRI